MLNITEFIFFSADLINNTAVVRAAEGEDITVECPVEYLSFIQPRDDCLISQDKDMCLSYFRPILFLRREETPLSIIETSYPYAEVDRFSLTHGDTFMTVGIRNLNQADSGRYICGAQARSGPTSSMLFEIDQC